ncbi:MAG: DoxX family protein [Saprospiraceae bacterium]|jgi:putative oxidoreductase|nr:MAG: DoxX family protein [Candidatus Parvibacillus calidus]MBX2935723.1 DoxX family protein [Saprospiraceae bacterium]MBX7179045.1 DoxX family protein [Saprospiraceae bacterium]MCB0590638.1 DoxX family protein [Saprospiraceae bacterium]MCC7147967.1 DoxX family protein [Saprospiraceae bacterium]
MKDFLDLLGRIFIATIFIYEAYDSIYYFHMTKATMSMYGLTWRQDLLLVGAIILLVLGGLMVLIGYRSSFGAILLILYYLPVTLIVHSFWNDPVKVQRIQAIMFMKNIAIMGGLLMIIVNGSGRYSIKRLLATLKV